jgi:hypothetical protein
LYFGEPACRQAGFIQLIQATENHRGKESH